MKTITAEQFKQFVDLDPAWASKLTESTEVIDFCDMKSSCITHLSPLLTFSGKKNRRGDVASFVSCQYLKIAEGTFVGMVSFANSGIERIGSLNITQPNKYGEAASFSRCRHLEIAEGNFPGSVDFTDSGIKTIGNLITQPNQSGIAAEFRLCKQLTAAEGIYNGHVDFSDSYIEEIGNLSVTQSNPFGEAASFGNCKGLCVANGSFAGSVDFQGSGIARIDKLSITQPDDKGQFLCVEWCPISENTRELAKVFAGKSLEELAVVLHACHDRSVKKAIEEMIGRIVLKQGKDAQPHFEL